MNRIVALYGALACAAAAAPSALEVSRSLREAGLDPEECYRVRDLSLHREDIRLYFTDGYLMFGKPVAGARFSAVFTADIEGGEAEVILLPPRASERASLAKFTGSPNLNERFRNAVTAEMKSRGLGEGYRYPHDEGGFAAGETYLPDALAGERFYDPKPVGYEARIKEHLERLRKTRV